MSAGQFSLAIIGGGNMGAALLSGILNGGPLGAHDIVVVELGDDRRAQLEAEFPGVAIATEAPAVPDVLVAVKPQHVADALNAIRSVGPRRVLSVAAGVTTETMASITGPDVALIRAMPNTPALVGQGVTAICAGPGAVDSDLEWAEGLLAPTGLVIRVDESQMDAVTGLTGSGPAYLFRVAEALIEAGLSVGLPDQIVEPMVTQLMVGSAALLAEEGDPGALRVAVTSPGGTTAEGLRVLEEGNLGDTVQAAVRAATERSRELGSQAGG